MDIFEYLHKVKIIIVVFLSNTQASPADSYASLKRSLLSPGGMIGLTGCSGWKREC